VRGERIVILGLHFNLEHLSYTAISVSSAHLRGYLPK
jgi:hypothetical protein